LRQSYYTNKIFNIFIAKLINPLYSIFNQSGDWLGEIKMIKALVLTLGYAGVVAFALSHFFGSELSEAMPHVNNNSGREMATMICCIPGCWFILDYLQNRENSPE
jgi:hypothetical protein